MGTKTIYVNPGDNIEIKVINDPELPKNNKEWAYQIRPKKIQILVASEDHIQIWDKNLIISQIYLNGQIYKYR